MMSNADELAGLENNLRELDVFRAQWQAELRQRRSRTLAFIASSEISEPEPRAPNYCILQGRSAKQYFTEDTSTPVVAIWTLNDDVLCAIFNAVVSLDPPLSMEDLLEITTQTENTSPIRTLARPRPRRTKNRMGWLRLTHVCQRWRDILLGEGMSHLWGRLAFTFPSTAAFPVLLSRSGRSPVDAFLSSRFDIGARADSQPGRLQAVETNLHRTRSLKVHSELTRDLVSFFANPLSVPSLQDLKLQLEPHIRHHPHVLWGMFTGVLGAPDDAGGNDSPIPDARIVINGPNVNTASVKLMRFRAGGSVYPDLRLSLPNLRRLDVRVLDNTVRPHDLSWLISLLSTSPLLEALSLHIALEGITPIWDTLFIGSPPRLLHLKELALKGCQTIDYAPFMDQILESPPTFISASCGLSRHEALVGNIPQETLHFIHHFSNYLCRSGHRALHISATPSDASAIEYVVGVQSMPSLEDFIILDSSYPRHFVDLQVPNALSDSLPGTVELSFKIPLPQATVQPWLEVLSSRIGHKELIEQLDIRIPQIASNEWMEAFRTHLLLPMTGLRGLYMPQHHPRTVEAWENTVNILRPSPFLIFPALHTLLVAFMPEAFHRAENPLESWWSPLLEMLTQRHASGSPIRTLRIVGLWTPEWKANVQDRDAWMISQADAFVDNVVDERKVRIHERVGRVVHIGRAV